MSSERIADYERETRETRIRVRVNLDGSGQCEVSTGIGFLDHMLGAMGKHGGLDIALSCDGDLHIDDHHAAEDCAIALGSVIDRALGERRGIARFGYAYAPLDEALARGVVDLSGRPSPNIDLGLTRERIGEIACENIEHVLGSLAIAMRASAHVDVLKGRNDHHRAEAAFKAMGLALKMALAPSGRDEIPSTKGVL